jgi:hypothetical protein
VYLPDGAVQRGNNSIDVATQHRPLGISKDNDGNLAQGQVLLKSYILVGCYKYLETGGLCGIKQGAVSERLPSAFDRLNNNMVFERIAQWCRYAVIKEDEHGPSMPRIAVQLAVDQGFARRTLNVNDLLACEVEPFHDLFDRGARLEVFKYERNWHACAFEHPGSTDLARDAFHGRALGPIENCHVFSLGSSYASQL